MPFRRSFFPNVLDFPVGTDPVGHAHDSEERFSEETFHPPRTIGFDDFEFRIGEQREIQIVLLFEFRLTVDGIRAASQNHRVQLIEFFLRVAKLGRFIGSTRSHRLREEVEHYALAAQIFERDVFAVVSLHREFRRSGSYFENVAHGFTPF